jgi:hypothetical protein
MFTKTELRQFLASLAFSILGLTILYLSLGVQ